MSNTGRSVERRRFLKEGLGGTALVALGGCLGKNRSPRAESESELQTSARPSSSGVSAADAETPTVTPTPPSSLSDVRGAIYFPARAYNNYQMWANYDPGGTVRDLTFARELGLNALRVLLSYEFWRDNPEACRRYLDHFVAAAERRGVRVLPVLFESIGRRPVPANRSGETPLHSPDRSVLTDRSRWDGPRRFVEWFVDRYAGRDALLAVEIMNEPGGWAPREAFCQAMLRAARGVDADVPLTMGSKSLEDNERYENPGLDVYQFHYNIPPTADDMREALHEAEAVSAESGKPVWLTEWQRTRVEPPHRMLPNYASLASVIRKSDIQGDFFWQLMLKPAYFVKQRNLGRVNGVFTEDGEVYSLDDARAIAGEEVFWRERPERPDWMPDPPWERGDGGGADSAHDAAVRAD